MATDKLSDRLPAYQAYLDLSTRLAPLTKRTYLYALGLIIKHVQDCSLADLSPAVLLEWHGSLAKAKAAPKTSGQKRAALKKFLEYLEEFEGSDQAAKLLRALDRLQAPGDTRPKREPHVLEEVDVLRMLARASLHVLTGGRDVAIIHFLWATGVRRAEVASLLLNNVDLEERVAIVVGKANKERVVIFDQECRESLDIWLAIRKESWPKRDGVKTFFININGYPMKPENVSTVVTTCAMEAGLQGKVWPHLFRHSALTRLLDNGVSIQDVAKLAGHANISTTARYHHAEEGRLKEIYDRATRGSQNAGDGYLPTPE
jgi:site-specific recombinase XerD